MIGTMKQPLPTAVVVARAAVAVGVLAVVAFIVAPVGRSANLGFVGGVALWNLLPFVMWWALTRKRSWAIPVAAGAVVATTFATLALGCGAGVLCKADAQAGLVALFVPVYQTVGGAVVALVVAGVRSLLARAERGPGSGSPSLRSGEGAGG